MSSVEYLLLSFFCRHQAQHFIFMGNYFDKIPLKSARYPPLCQSKSYLSTEKIIETIFYFTEETLGCELPNGAVLLRDDGADLGHC